MGSEKIVDIREYVDSKFKKLGLSIDTKESSRNKITGSFGNYVTSADKYAGVKAIYDWSISVFEQLENKKSDIEANKTSDTFYPSVKAVYDFIMSKVQELTELIDSASATADNVTISGTGTDTDPFRISDEMLRRINAGI